ncbi:MAG: phage terminase large subunit [Brevundimonas sp.]|uniref:phage terminase large subunit n=1 Tax=Brevundimonas sp. TaxID=1871086 RepID=UPI00391B1B97
MSSALAKQAALHAFARENFEAFLYLVFHHLNPGVRLSSGWYIQAMVQALMDVEAGHDRRLQITVPPRHLKSEMVSIAYPAWLMGRRPETRIICASYSQDLADNLARKFRKVVESNWYADVFPQMAASIVRSTTAEFTTSAGGYRYATAVGGTVTGIGAHLIIVDDLMKASDSAYPEARAKAKRFVDETLMSRLDDKKTGAVVAIMQRLHEDDVSAHLAAKGSYRHLNLPAIAVQDETIRLTRGAVHNRRIGDILNPLREPHDVLQEFRLDVGQRVFEAQWQQNPSAGSNDFLRWEKVQFYDDPPERDRLQMVVHSWDPAATCDPGSDYSVGTVWGYDGEAWLLLDVIRIKLAYSDLLARVRAERRRWNADYILVEKSSVGHALLPDLIRDHRGLGQDRAHYAPRSKPIAASTRVPKTERFFSSVDRLYTGLGKFPRSAPWMDDLRHELQAFPDVRHDDQADSISQFLNWAVGRGGRTALNPHARRDIQNRT